MSDFLPSDVDNKKHYFTREHDLRVDGHRLIERKTKISWKVNGKYGHIKDFVWVFTRSIDDRSYKVTEIHGQEGQEHQQPKFEIDTNMTEDEVKKFEEDWTSLWNLGTISLDN